MTLFNGDSSAYDLPKLVKSLMQVLMSPLVAKAFHEDVALGLDTSEQVFVIRQSSARFTMQLRELYVV